MVSSVLADGGQSNSLGESGVNLVSPHAVA